MVRLGGRRRPGLEVLYSDGQRIKVNHTADASAATLHPLWTTLVKGLVLHNHVVAPRPIDRLTAHDLSPKAMSYLCIVRRDRLFPDIAHTRVNRQEASGAMVWFRCRLTSLRPGKELGLGGHCDALRCQREICQISALSHDHPK